MSDKDNKLDDNTETRSSPTVTADGEMNSAASFTTEREEASSSVTLTSGHTDSEETSVSVTVTLDEVQTSTSVTVTTDVGEATIATDTGDIYSSPIALGFHDELDVTSGVLPPYMLSAEHYPGMESDLNSSSAVCKKDFQDMEAVRGRCGLYNLGNTCFMNAGLQCIMSTVPLVNFLLEYQRSNPHFDQTLFGEFKRLFMKMWSGRYGIVHPKDFKQALGMYHPQFVDFRQHDSQEFLALLLDSLHEQLNVKRNATNQNAESAPCNMKHPINFEHNIINNPVNSPVDTVKDDVNCHPHLTFDNMKQVAGCLRSSKTVSSEITDEFECGEKDKNASNIASFVISQVSEDSNHSSLSEQSSESEQCSVIKNLKLRSSPVISQSSESLSPKLVNMTCGDVGMKDCNTTLSANNDGSVLVKETSCDEGDCKNVGCFKRIDSLQDLKKGLKGAVAIDVADDGRIATCGSDGDLVKMEAREVNAGQLLDVKPNVFDQNFEGDDDISDSSVLDVDQKSNLQVSDTVSEPVILNNAVTATNVPSLEDLYAKETKTLNTNVLAMEYMDDSVTLDSGKFSKPDNTGGHVETMDEEEILNNMMEASDKKDGNGSGRIKNTNLRADKKSRSPKGACGSASITRRDGEDCFTMNSVKRMKFDGTEKNLQMEEMSKICKQRLTFGTSKSDQGKKLCGGACVGVVAGTVDADSDADSDMMDEEQDGEMDISDDDDGVMREGAEEAQDRAVFVRPEVLAADEAWQKYHTNNDSVVVDTFQGQFKSTVVCADCHQVSVTFEPFMYLSVPVPHAMERQISVTFISQSCKPTQYLLVMHKHDKIQKVKQELCHLIGRDNCDIIMAEVLDWHISRILEDNVMLRYVNDSSRKIYAFEIIPTMCGGGDTSTCDISTGIAQDHSSARSQDDQPTTTTADTCDIFANMGSFSAPSSTFNSQTSYGSHSVNYSPLHSQSYSLLIDNTADGLTDTQDSEIVTTTEVTRGDLIGTGLWEWSAQSVEKRRGSLETETGGGGDGDGDTWPIPDVTNNLNDFDDEDDVGDIEKSDDQTNNTVSSSSATATIGEEWKSSAAVTSTAGEWKSCAICLEELTDTELMVHTACGGTFCPNCLEMSVQHYRDSTYCCPVCSIPADMTEDFVPLASAANHKPKTRIVTVPITYRCEGDGTGVQGAFLFAHPGILSLPSNLTGQHIYSCVSNISPVLREFKVVMTDGQGLHCSRCLYMEHCSGCVIPRDGEVVLRPGDHLTIAVPAITLDQISQSQAVTDHESMEKQRSSDPTTLGDCFTAFTQSEVLDEHNPWFCPHCKQNQQAEKTMTVWRYPDSLIIQLKRFVFHELSSTKVDNKVVFPLDTLDLQNLISGPQTRTLQYSLYSLVCHSGGANAGHYTSYARHPVDGRWYYYNDETVCQQTPGENEFTSTYVLFYQRKGTDKAIQLPDDLDILCEAAGDTVPSVVFQPPEGELTLDIDQAAPSTSCNNKVAPSTSCNNQSAPSTSCNNEVVPSTSCTNEVASSTGACDLTASSVGYVEKVESYETNAWLFLGTDHAGGEGSSHSRVEQAEADSTSTAFDFYS